MVSWILLEWSCCSVAKLSPTLWDPLSCRTPGFPVLHNFPEFAQTLTHQSQWCHPTTLFSVAPSPPTFNLSQHQGLFQWISSLHHVAKALELWPQHQFFQWIFRVDFLQGWLVWFMNDSNRIFHSTACIWFMTLFVIHLLIRSFYFIRIIFSE